MDGPNAKMNGWTERKNHCVLSTYLSAVVAAPTECKPPTANAKAVAAKMENCMFDLAFKELTESTFFFKHWEVM